MKPGDIISYKHGRMHVLFEYAECKVVHINGKCHYKVVSVPGSAVMLGEKKPILIADVMFDYTKCRKATLTEEKLFNKAVGV